MSGEGAKKISTIRRVGVWEARMALVFQNLGIRQDFNPLTIVQ